MVTDLPLELVGFAVYWLLHVLPAALGALPTLIRTNAGALEWCVLLAPYAVWSVLADVVRHKPYFNNLELPVVGLAVVVLSAVRWDTARNRGGGVTAAGYFWIPCEIVAASALLVPRF